MTDQSRSAFRGLRFLGNLAALLALLIGLDAAVAWWRDTPSFTCGAAITLSSEGAQTVIGMTGVLVALVGIMLGGVRHALTALGLVLLVGGVVGSALLPEFVASVCGG